jgi:predicted MPP superfamily phosphohydrolase
LILLARLLRRIPFPIPESFLFISGLSVIILAMGLSIYGMYHARQLQKVTYSIKVNQQASSLSDLNIVQVSDLHLGNIYGNNFLSRLVNDINQLEPDIVCITGDIFDNNFNALSDPEEGVRILSSIQSTYGTFACLGNHDTGNTFDLMLDFLEQCNIKVLMDEYMVIEDKFVIVGRDDSSPIGYQGGLQRGKLSDIMEVTSVNSMEVTNVNSAEDTGVNDNSFTSHDLPVIVMDHQPSNISEYGDETALLMFGHTHKGQMFPFSFITNAMFVVDHGHYQKDANSPHVIVTSGAATWGPPIRVGTDSEVVNIKMQFE